jgi:predicted Zn-dependent peptidase
MSEIHRHTYANGLVLLVEPMDSMESVGMTLMTPGGVSAEPADRLGVASVVTEMMFRGAGDLDARAHSEAMDRLGIRRDCDIHTRGLSLGAVLLGDRLDESLKLILSMARQAHLPESSLPAAVQLSLGAIEGLEDDPQDKVMVELKRDHLPDPLGRSDLGEAEHLKAMTMQDVRDYYARCFVPGGAVLTLSGKVDFEHARDLIGELLGDWQGAALEAPVGAASPGGYRHVKADSSQQHIGLAFDAVGGTDPHCMTQRLGIAVLSGGMSGRLFTEVRENRGLCYSVYASYAAMKDRGVVYAYSGTTTERAQETLEVLGAELKKLSDGVEADEFERAVVGLKSRVVMQGESTSARSMALAVDEVVLGRPRTLDDLIGEVESVTLDGLNDFVASHSPEGFTTLTVGPEPLKV